MIKRAVKITALLIAFVGITAASAYLALTLIIQSEETVIVPELVGREVVYALELLTGLELDIKVKGFEYNGSVAKHHVIFQHPAAGAEIKKGRDVKIILSKGPETVTLPNFTGVSFPASRGDFARRRPVCGHSLPQLPPRGGNRCCHRPIPICRPGDGPQAVC